MRHVYFMSREGAVATRKANGRTPKPGGFRCPCCGAGWVTAYERTMHCTNCRADTVVEGPVLSREMSSDRTEPLRPRKVRRSTCSRCHGARFLPQYAHNGGECFACFGRVA